MNQHYFVNIFKTTFLCAAVAGTILWTIDVILIIHRSCVFLRRHLNQSKAEERTSEENTEKSKCNFIVGKIGINYKATDRIYGRSTCGDCAVLLSSLASMWGTYKKRRFVPHNDSYYCIFNAKLNMDNAYLLLGIVRM